MAPYLYNGWGDPPDPTTIMNATGVKWFTLAFVLSNGTCNPQWDGGRALTGGVDQATIDKVRAAGGDVIPSFGGYSGNKLEQSCTSASALAGAYQKVISAYGLKAIDIDIEADAYSDGTVQQRVVDALKTVKANNPGISVYVTIGTGQSGPDTGLIGKAAASGLTVDSWTIMPFDFGGAGQNMGNLTTQAADGLKNDLKNAYGYSDDEAYRHSGISSMNGITDEQRDRHPGRLPHHPRLRPGPPPGPADLLVRQPGPALPRRLPQRRHLFRSVPAGMGLHPHPRAVRGVRTR